MCIDWQISFRFLFEFLKMELSNEEDRKIFLSPSIAQRIFSEQLKVLIESCTGSSETVTNWHEILVYHKKQYGYQILPQSLGFHDMFACIEALPYVEVRQFHLVCLVFYIDFFFIYLHVAYFILCNKKRLFHRMG